MLGHSSRSSVEDGQETGQFQSRVMSVAMEEAQGGRGTQPGLGTQTRLPAGNEMYAVT